MGRPSQDRKSAQLAHVLVREASNARDGAQQVLGRNSLLRASKWRQVQLRRRRGERQGVARRPGILERSVGQRNGVGPAHLRTRLAQSSNARFHAPANRFNARPPLAASDGRRGQAQQSHFAVLHVLVSTRSSGIDKHI